MKESKEGVAKNSILKAHSSVIMRGRIQGYSSLSLYDHFGLFVLLKAANKNIFGVYIQKMLNIYIYIRNKIS